MDVNKPSEADSIFSIDEGRLLSVCGGLRNLDVFSSL
jgi:hypothetical protein